MLMTVCVMNVLHMNSMSLVVAGHLPLVAFFLSSATATASAPIAVIITFANKEIVITLPKYTYTCIFTHKCTSGWLKLNDLYTNQLHATHTQLISHEEVMQPSSHTLINIVVEDIKNMLTA